MRIGYRLGVLALSLAVLGCSSLPPGNKFPRQDSRAVPPHHDIVGHEVARANSNPDLSAFRMLPMGVDGLAARVELIDAASSALDLQYYIFRGDESGALITQALLRAADRGVRVRVLVDDGDTVVGDEHLFALAAHPSIQIRIFNPFEYRGHIRVLRAMDFLFHKRRLDCRMHNKLLVADNELALLGGRNIGNQYFQIDPNSQFGDDDVAAYGPVVQRLSTVFDQFWNSPLSIPAPAIDMKNTSHEALLRLRGATAGSDNPAASHDDLTARIAAGQPLADITSGRAPLAWAGARLIYDSPDKSEVVDGVAPGKLIYSAVEKRTRNVRHELLMITPYFVPAAADLSLLQMERGRGVRVEILTNSLESAPDTVAQAGYTHYRHRLLSAGVRLYEVRASPESAAGTGQPRSISRYGNYGLHAKLYIFDREALFVGSMNFDQRSKKLNTEIGLIIDSPEMAAAAALRFESLTQPSNSYSVSFRGQDTGEHAHLLWTTERDHIAKEYSVEPARNEWQRFKMKLLSLLPLDREL